MARAIFVKPRAKRAGPPGATEKRALRAASVVRIRELLAGGPLTVIAIAADLGVSNSGAYAFLRYMAHDLREVRKVDHQDEKGRDLWELGEDPMLPTPDELLDASFAQRKKAVPARQIGLPRDPLVAALFGPTGGAAA